MRITRLRLTSVAVVAPTTAVTASVTIPAGRAAHGSLTPYSSIKLVP